MVNKTSTFFLQEEMYWFFCVYEVYQGHMCVLKSMEYRCIE